MTIADRQAGESTQVAQQSAAPASATGALVAQAAIMYMHIFALTIIPKAIEFAAMISETHAAIPPKDSLGILLGLVRTEVVRALEAEFAAQHIDLSFTQFLIIKRLLRLGPMAAGELARSVELDGGAMTRQLDQLERKGYLRRCRHEQDRRALRIELTPQGSALLQRLTDCHQRVLEAAQQSLDSAERKRLHDYLERVLRALRDKP
jgi:DNA-binding MarR family transcriptional regulator